jgi:hypothetical protein
MADVAFWVGIQRRFLLKLTDRLLISGNIKTDPAQYIEVQDLPFISDASSFAKQFDLTAETAARIAADAAETAARIAADNAIEQYLGAFNTASALATKLDTMKTAADVGRYRFRVSAAFNHSLEIYRVANVFIQVIRGTIMLDDDGNLSDNYSITDFVQIERHLSANSASKWKYSKTAEPIVSASPLVMPFSGFVDGVIINANKAPVTGNIYFDRTNNKFVMKSFIPQEIYYIDWDGREEYSDSTRKPLRDKIYVTNENICAWNGTKMIVTSESAGEGSGESVDLTEINSAISLLQRTGFKHLEKNTDLDEITEMGAYYIGAVETGAPLSKDFMFVTGNINTHPGTANHFAQIYFSTEGIKWRMYYPQITDVSPAYWGDWQTSGDGGSIDLISEKEIDNLFT